MRNKREDLEVSGLILIEIAKSHSKSSSSVKEWQKDRWWENIGIWQVGVDREKSRADVGGLCQFHKSIMRIKSNRECRLLTLSFGEKALECASASKVSGVMAFILKCNDAFLLYKKVLFVGTVTMVRNCYGERMTQSFFAWRTVMLKGNNACVS